MAFTQADIDALDVSIKAGALSVRYADGRAVTYRSLDEMMRIRVLMQSDVLDYVDRSATGLVRIYPEYGKGC